MKRIFESIISDGNFMLFLVVSIFMVLFFLKESEAAKVKTVFLDDKMVMPIQVSPQGTAIDFPIKPDNVVLGQNGSFGLEYIKSDIVVSPLRSNAKSNLFVYLFGRRYTFDLSISQFGDTIVIVRDKQENLMKATP